MQQNMQGIAQDFQKITTEKIQEIWQRKINQPISSISGVGRKKAGIKRLAKDMNLSKELTNALIKAQVTQNKQQFYALMGKAYEDFIPDQILNPVIEETLGELANNGTQDVMKAFTMGDKTSTSSFTSGKTYTRTDVGLSFSMELTERDRALYSNNSELPLELQGSLRVEDTQDLFAERISTPEITSILQQYLQQDPTQQFFGFQLKYYQDINTNTAKWAESSVIASRLNAIYNQTDSKGARHSWNEWYIEPYVVYYLSHYLIDIINPVNIGLITGRELIWMDQLLSQHVFYLQVAFKESIGKHQAGEGRVFPQIENNKILMSRNYNNFKEITSRRVTGKEAGNLRISFERTR